MQCRSAIETNDLVEGLDGNFVPRSFVYFSYVLYIPKKEDKTADEFTPFFSR